MSAVASGEGSGRRHAAIVGAAISLNSILAVYLVAAPLVLIGDEPDRVQTSLSLGFMGLLSLIFALLLYATGAQRLGADLDSVRAARRFLYGQAGIAALMLFDVMPGVRPGLQVGLALALPWLIAGALGVCLEPHIVEQERALRQRGSLIDTRLERIEALLTAQQTALASSTEATPSTPARRLWPRLFTRQPAIKGVHR